MTSDIASNISEKQLEANRENAKLGGVKTEEGKIASKYNALKHGLLSEKVLLSDENEAELVSLGKRLRQELVPDSELELILVDRITANTWRLRRAMQVEREMMEEDRINLFGGSDKKKSLGEALSGDFSNHDTYGKFIRYEASLERGIYKALHELQRVQAARKGESTPPPVAIDVDVSGEK